MLDAISESADDVAKAWGGSWLGYQSRVYFRHLRPPPAGAHFSSEWGFQSAFSNETSEGWEECTFDSVKKEILRRAGAPDLAAIRTWATTGKNLFKEKRDQVISILEATISERSDSYLERLRDETKELSLLSAADFIARARPHGGASRDSLAISQGLQTPPHIALLAELAELRSPAIGCGELQRIAGNAGAHLGRVERKALKAERIGTSVFIGHGRSPLWKDLKDFFQDRLRVPWDEFNRVPVAGVTNIARLSEMLDSAAVAFLVMTGEDERADGGMHARENVVHEAGLFQGRLGFSRAIILLEEGCQEFSNIEGLGHIQFPKGNIKACFEEVRQVLERESLLGA